MLHRTLLPVSAPPSGRRLGRSRTTEIGDRCRHEFKVYNRGDPPVPHRRAGEGTCPLPAVTVRQPPHPDTCRPRHALMYAFPDRPLLPVLSPASSTSNGLRKAVIHLTAQTGHTTSRTVRNGFFPFGQCSSPITASKKRCRHAQTHDRDKRFAPAEPLSRTWLNMQLPGRKIFTSGRSDRTFFRYLRVPSQS